MNQIEIQRKIFITVVGLVLMSIVLIIIAIPSVLQDTSAGAKPESAATGIVIMMILHMVVLFGFWKAIGANKQGRPADKNKRKAGLKVLNSIEKKEWGEKVIEMLESRTDLKKDNFFILAGQEYIKPIIEHITHYALPL